MDKDEALNQPDELAELLKELGNTEPLPSQKKKVKKPTQKKKKEDDDDDDMIVAPPIPRRERPKPAEPLMLVQPVAEESSEELPDIFNKHFTQAFKQYNTIFNDIIQNYHQDRIQAQEAIDAFMTVITTGGKVPRIYLEKIADVIRAKNEIAHTAIKALESIPKLMSASKGNEIFNQVNMSFDSSQLAKILDTEKYDDELDADSE